MATFVKFEKLSEDVARAVHDFAAAGHTVNVYLSNTAPNAATHSVKADVAEIATGNGYAGPIDVENDISRSGAATTVTGVNKTVTASGGSVGPFRYAVLYNDTPTSPADPLLGYWDYAEEVTLADGEGFQIQFPTGLLVIGG